MGRLRVGIEPQGLAESGNGGVIVAELILGDAKQNVRLDHSRAQAAGCLELVARSLKITFAQQVESLL